MFLYNYSRITRAKFHLLLQTCTQDGPFLSWSIGHRSPLFYYADINALLQRVYTYSEALCLSHEKYYPYPVLNISVVSINTFCYKETETPLQRKIRHESNRQADRDCPNNDWLEEVTIAKKYEKQGLNSTTAFRYTKTRETDIWGC